MSRPKNGILQAVTWSAIDSWGSRLFSLIIVIALARMLEPRAFGLVGMATVYVSLVAVFVEQGLGAALIQRSKLDPQHLDSAFWISVVSGVLLALLSVVVADPVAAVFREPALAPIIRWLSLGLVLSGLQGTQRAILRRDLAFDRLAIRSLIASVAGGVIGITTAVLGFGVWSLVAQTLSEGVVGTVTLWSVSQWRPRLHFSMQHFQDLLGFSAHVFGANLLSFVNRRSDDLLIGWALGPVALGYYTVAYGFLKTMTLLLVGMIEKVAFPMFSRLQEDPARMRRAFYTATRYTSLIAFPAFLGVTAVAPEFVLTIYGPKWIPSIRVMQVLSVIGILQSAFYFNGSVLLAVGKSSWRLGINALNAVTNVVAFLIAVRWGIVAVAAAYVIRGYLVSPIPVWAVRRLIGIDIRAYLKQIVAPLIGSIFMVGSIWLLRLVLPETLPVPFRLAVLVFGGAIVYAGVIYAQVPELPQDFLRTARGTLPKPVPVSSRP